MDKKAVTNRITSFHLLFIYFFRALIYFFYSLSPSKIVKICKLNALYRTLASEVITSLLNDSECVALFQKLLCFIQFIKESALYVTSSVMHCSWANR